MRQRLVTAVIHLQCGGATGSPYVTAAMPGGRDGWRADGM